MSENIKFFIIFSVILNVLFIGISGGFIMKHRHFAGNEKSITSILSEAPIPEDRKLFLENQINAIFENSHAAKKDMEQIHVQAFKIMTAPTFDAEAYQAQMDKMFEERNKDRKNISEDIKKLAGQLSFEERVALANVLQNMPKRH